METGFLQTLRETPRDTTTLCAYSDWLEDQGDSRAEFVRLVAKIESLPPASQEWSDVFDDLTTRKKSLDSKWVEVLVPPLPKQDAPLGWQKVAYFSDDYERTDAREHALLRKLEAWPLDFLKNKLGDNPVFEEADIDPYLRDYRRFMFFKGQTDEWCGVFSPRLDAVWHQHILYTRDYTDFCESIFGHYVHHTPCDLIDYEENRKALSAWLLDYAVIFNNEQPLDLPNDLRQYFGCG